MSEATETTAGPKYYSLRGAAAVCEVHHTRVRAWCRGIRVGGTTVRLAADVMGDRIRITPEAIKVFRADCRRAMLGPDAPDPRPETPRQERARVEAGYQEVLRMCGVPVDEDGNPLPRRKPARKPR